jgi:hypothetical protein
LGDAGSGFDVGTPLRMPTPSESSRPRKTVENWLLLLVGLLAHAPLYYQLPRWANGLDPIFVHPKLMAESKFPIVLHMAAIHPIVWICVTVLCFARLCYNFGWKLRR